MAGTIIPAAMVTGLNSDLPGQAIATVTEPVYDTVTGKSLLIPQGSRLLGTYDAQVSYGQSRVLLVWTRLIMPDGSSIVLDRLPGADTKGFAGLEDETDNHWGKLLAGAALSTLLGVGAELGSQNSGLGGTGQQTVVVATSRSAEESVNQVGQQVTRRNLNVQPTLTVRPGFPVRVIVNKDLVLRPYGARCAPHGRKHHDGKLRLGPLPKTEVVRLTIALPARSRPTSTATPSFTAPPTASRRRGRARAAHAGRVHGARPRVPKGASGAERPGRRPSSSASIKAATSSTSEAAGDSLLGVKQPGH